MYHGTKRLLYTWNQWVIDTFEYVPHFVRRSAASSMLQLSHMKYTIAGEYYAAITICNIDYMWCVLVRSVICWLEFSNMANLVPGINEYIYSDIIVQIRSSNVSTWTVIASLEHSVQYKTTPRDVSNDALLLVCWFMVSLVWALFDSKYHSIKQMGQ